MCQTISTKRDAADNTENRAYDAFYFNLGSDIVAKGNYNIK